MSGTAKLNWNFDISGIFYHAARRDAAQALPKLDAEPRSFAVIARVINEANFSGDLPFYRSWQMLLCVYVRALMNFHRRVCQRSRMSALTDNYFSRRAFVRRLGESLRIPFSKAQLVIAVMKLVVLVIY